MGKLTLPAVALAIAHLPVTLASAQESVKSTPKDTNIYSRAAVPADTAASTPMVPNTAVAPRAPDAAPLSTTNVMRVWDVVVNNTNPNLKTTDTIGGTEASVAVNPNDRNQIAVSGFSGSWGSGNAPIWVSTDGGQTWTKQLTIPVPPGAPAAQTSGCPCDQTFDYGTTNELFGTFLTEDASGNSGLYSGSTTNPASAASWAWWVVAAVAQKSNLVGTDPDQPWLLYNRGTANAAFQNVFVAYDDFGTTPVNMRVSASINQVPPQFASDQITGNSGLGGINPGHRLANDPRNGWMYSLYQSCTANCGADPKTISFMLNRSTDQGTSWSLNSNPLGIEVASAQSHQPTPKFGTVNALLGGIDHGAVDLSTGDLYYVYGYLDAGNNNLAIRRVFDNGAGGVNVGAQNIITTTPDVCAIPSVAITRHGAIGVFFYCYNGIVSGFPQFTAWLGVSANQGAGWSFNPLVTFLSPAVDNGNARQRVLGDYEQLKAIDNCFYAGFVANRAAFFGSLAVDDPIFAKACYGQSASTHDFNGNGMSDVLFRNSGGGIAAWLLNNNAAVQSAVGIGSIDNNWGIIGQRDLNGDGVHDILFRHTDGSVAEWLLSTNGAIVSAVGLGNPTTNWNIVGTGDFNGDGIGDILWRGGGTAVAIWYMNASGGLASAVGVGSLPSQWGIAGTADFDGDGINDILWYHTSGAIAVWLMNSNGTIKSAVGLGSLNPAAWGVAGTGDFDGDGINDILWRDLSGNVLAIWFMNASGGVRSAQSVGMVPSGWTIAETGDFNGDGMSDILLYHSASGSVGTWLMNGATITSAIGIGSLPPASWSVVTANGD